MIVAGLGCRTECAAEEIVALVREAEARAQCQATALAAPATRARAPSLRRAAVELRLALLSIDHAAMEQAQPRCVTRSDAALRAVGLASVAEAAALAAAGPTSRLRLPRISSAHATCAIAEIA